MKGKRLQGMVSAPITPTDASGALAASLFKPMVDHAITCGVDGFFAIGSTGTFPLFTVAERKKAAELFVEAVNGRVPLCVHIGATDEATSLELAKHAGSIGVDSFAAVPPYYFNYDGPALIAYFSKIAAVNPDLPFYIYNIPMFARNDIAPALLKQLRDAIPNLQGVKDTTQDFTRYLDYLDAMGTGFDSIMGSDAMCVAALSAGGVGGICAMAVHNPELMVDIFNAWRQGDMARAQHLQFIAANLRLMFQKLPFFTPRVVIMRMRKILDAYPRAPFRALTADEEKVIVSTMRGLEERFNYPLLTEV